jgi:hypothetical protein
MKGSSMNIRTLITVSLALLAPGALNAMEIFDPKTSVALPTIQVSMKISDPNQTLAAQFPPKPAISETIWLAQPNERGEYTLHQSCTSICKVKYVALLTSIRNTNSTAPLITYRFEKPSYFDKGEEESTKKSDSELSIAYATTRMLDVKIENEDGSHQPLNLEISIVRITNESMYLT